MNSINYEGSYYWSFLFFLYFRYLRIKYSKRTCSKQLKIHTHKKQLPVFTLISNFNVSIFHELNGLYAAYTCIDNVACSECESSHE
jgi:hypothetical protein